MLSYLAVYCGSLVIFIFYNSTPLIITRQRAATEMASTLPSIPRYVFGVVEPAILILAFAITSLSPAYYVASQSRLPASHNLLPSETILVYQLSNLFLLVAVIELYVFYSTTDAKVVRALLTALWWGDLGHLGVTMWCMGLGKVVDVASWGVANWGNIAIPLFLCTMRTMYLFGDVLVTDMGVVAGRKQS